MYSVKLFLVLELDKDFKLGVPRTAFYFGRRKSKNIKPFWIL